MKKQQIKQPQQQKSSLQQQKHKKTSSTNQTQSTKKSTQQQQQQQIKTQAHYRQTYKEIELIGKGTSGSATLVRHILERKYYISKKIKISAMSETDKQKAAQEIKFLQTLKHPNIVEFKESFQDKNNIIIIMEYCEDGDLAYHIKNKQKGNEKFKQSTVLNWFLQILMALDFIHSKKILHRDIKASNIFVSQCGSIKIGDFGIAKQLDQTYDKALTLVGTPYYLSPEVCENKPYTYQSDIWALGCLLFEMCTLDHPFNSDNLMSLVFKIIKDDVPDLPTPYTENLNILCKLLLQKDQESRPLAKEILCTEIVMQSMDDFIQKKGNIEDSLPIKKLNIHEKKEKIKQIQTNNQKKSQQTPQKTPQKKSANKSSISNQSSQQKKSAQKQKEIEKQAQSNLEKIQKEIEIQRQQIEQEKQQQKQEQKCNQMLQNIQKDIEQQKLEIQKQKQSPQKQSKQNNSSSKKQQQTESQLLLEQEQKISANELGEINKQIQIKEASQLSQQQNTQQNKQTDSNNNNSNLQMSQKTVESMYTSLGENNRKGSFNFDQTVNSIMTGSASSQADNPFQFMKKTQNKLDSISEQTDDQATISVGDSQQTVENQEKEHYLQQSSDITNTNQQQQPSVEKILYINQSIKNPDMYKSNKFNTSFFAITGMKESDFNLSLTNASAFNFQKQTLKDQQQNIKEEEEEEQKQQQESLTEDTKLSENEKLESIQTQIDNSSFLKDSNFNLSMTASIPFDLKAQQSFNVSSLEQKDTENNNKKSSLKDVNVQDLQKKLSSQSQQHLESDLNLENQNEKKEEDKEIQQKQSQNNTEQQNSQKDKFSKFSATASKDILTHTMRFSRQNEINNMKNSHDNPFHSNQNVEDDEDSEMEMLEIRDDLSSSSDERIDSNPASQEDIDEEISSSDLDSKRITKNNQVNELDEILNLYKSQLQQSVEITQSIKNKLINMTEIRETSAENILSGSDVDRFKNIPI